MARALLVVLLIAAVAVGLVGCGKRGDAKSAAAPTGVVAGSAVAGTPGGPPIDPAASTSAEVGIGAPGAGTVAEAAVGQAPGGGGMPTIAAPADITTGMTGKGRPLDTLDLGTPKLGGGSGELKTANDAPRVFPRGTTVVTWTVADASGNKATATQKVTIVSDAPQPGGQRR